ncbi:MAG: ABC-F family ATP-binding cassette domain-containing protein [bacterium]|nr:ABC-F family ATP-binding cassette domain-containing protein [bacterium]
MISVSNLGKIFGAQILFEGVAFQLNPGESYGLVGANGSGKSTLLKILSNEEPPSEGTISIPKRLRLGILRQDHFSFEQERILDVALMGNEDLWKAMAEKERILEAAEKSFDAERYSELEDVILRHDGYSAEARAGEILEGLGIETELHSQPLSTLSGGFKLRVLLAQTLAAQPEALLLDEPTNHLDILSIRWLEKFLQSFPGIVVVISHDHRFLDNVSTHILDVDYQTVTLYKGDYTSFVEQKVAQRERKEKDIDKREKEIAHHQAFVDRFRAKATKARQAKSKQKILDRIVLESLPMSSRRYPRFRFDQERPSGREALKIEGVSKAFGDNQVLEDVSLTVERGDRLAVIGPNGIGKSTLLKIAMGELDADGGSAEWGYEARPGYFAQDHHELLQPEKATVESWLWDVCPGEPIGFVRGQLAAVLFSKEEVEKRLGALSGGEAARLVFARLAVEKPNVLVLDEPTNHLDLEAIEALVHGLRDYPGTLIVVSHDRWFVAQLADRIVEISPNGIRDYRGTYEEYVTDCGDDHLDADAVLRQSKRKGMRQKAKSATPANPKRKRELTKRRDRLTEEIEKKEERVNEINELFCDPTFFDKTPPKQVKKLETEQADLKTKVEEMITDWEKVETELEELESES